MRVYVNSVHMHSLTVRAGCGHVICVPPVGFRSLLVSPSQSDLGPANMPAVFALVHLEAGFCLKQDEPKFPALAVVTVYGWGVLSEVGRRLELV